MEKLTKKDYEQTEIVGLDLVGLSENNADLLTAATDKLYEYELTGYSPSDIVTIKETYNNLFVVAMSNKKLQQERDNAIKKLDNLKYKILKMIKEEEEK